MKRFDNKRKLLTWCVAALLAVAIAAVVCVYSYQIQREAEAHQIAREVQRFTATNARFKEVVFSFSFWANHRPDSASFLDKVWNTMYPSIGGKVKTPNDLEELQRVIKVVCTQYRYDHRAIQISVALEG